MQTTQQQTAASDANDRIEDLEQQLSEWENLAPEALPVQAMVTLAARLFDTYRYTDSPQLSYAASVLMLLSAKDLLPLDGIILQTNVFLALDELDEAAVSLDLARAKIGRRRHADAKAMREIIQQQRLRLDIRQKVRSNRMQNAVRLFNDLPPDVLRDDPALYILAAIAHAELCRAHGTAWEEHGRRAIRLSDQYESIFGEIHEVQLQKGEIFEMLQSWGAAYDAYERARRLIGDLDESRRPRAMTAVSMAEWLMLRLDMTLTESSASTIEPATPALERIDLIHRAAFKGDWETLLNLTASLSLEDMTSCEGAFVAHAAIEKGDYPWAKAILDAIGHDEDGNVHRLETLTRYWYALGDKEKALEAVEKALRFCIDAKLYVGTADPIIQLAVRLSHDYCMQHNAFERFIQMVDAFPEAWMSPEMIVLNVQMMMNADLTHRETQYVARALNLLDGIRAKDRTLDWHLLHARLLMSDGKFDPAVKDFERAKRLLPKHHSHIETFRMIIENGLTQCREALTENLTGVAEGVGGQSRLLVDAMKAADMIVHKVIVEPGYVPLAIVERANNKTHKATLMTTALAYGQKRVEDLRPVELCMAIHKRDILTINAKDWRFKLLTTLARTLQTAHHVRPRPGMTLKSPDAQIIRGLDYPAVVLYDRWDDLMPKTIPVDVLEVVPIYEEEYHYAAVMSADRLFGKLLETAFYPGHRARSNALIGENWKMLIPRHKIRQIYDDHGMFGTVSKRILTEGLDAAVFFRTPDSTEHPLDSGWFFLSGGDDIKDVNLSDHFVMIDLNTICNYLPYVQPYLSAPPGAAYVRDPNGSVTSRDIEDMPRIIRLANKKPLLT